MIATTFDMVSLQKSLVSELNRQMLEAAEPIIQEALKRIEREMRQALAARLIGLIESNMSFERYGTDLRIVIKQAQTEQQRTTASGSPLREGGE